MRAGISEIILPKDNEADLEDIPEEVAEGLTFHCVEDLDSVIAIALVDEGKTKKGKGTRAPARKKKSQKEIQA